jgi:hypothetical protein
LAQNADLSFIPIRAVFSRHSLKRMPFSGDMLSMTANDSRIISWSRNRFPLAVFVVVMAGFILSGCDSSEDPSSSEPAKDPLQLAEGGTVTTEPVDESDPSAGVWEIHTFTGSDKLAFFDGSRKSVTADYLIVAGGGGAGGTCVTNDKAGGGGAGGLLYGAEQTLTLEIGAVRVTVGKGGAGGAARTQGTNGEDSAIGTIAMASGGGGGGGGNKNNTNWDGKAGGSGGGSGSGNENNAGTAGAASGTGLGNAGGKGGPNSGGGGGGAGGAGQDVPLSGGNVNVPGAGGAGWAPSGDAAWIAQVSGMPSAFSHGGRGGSYIAAAAGVAGANYGDGGDGNNAVNVKGNDGHSGIVIIRFKR